MPWELCGTRAIGAHGDGVGELGSGAGGAERAGEHRVPGGKKYVRSRGLWKFTHEAASACRAPSCACEVQAVGGRIGLRDVPNQCLALKEYYVDITRARGFAPPPLWGAAPAAAAPNGRNRQES